MMSSLSSLAASLNSRQFFGLLLLLAVTSMLYAHLFLEAMLNLEACPMCMTQRVFVVLWGAFALLAMVHNPRDWGQRVYGVLCGLSAWVGALVAARHVWLQNLPEDQVPACGPPLDYLLENFPLREAINTLLMGDGNCADVAWTFLGLSIPAQTLLVFLAVMLLCLWQSVRRYP
ncbi:MAG: disulfide bond formation protein B [Halioglobus sp.]